MPRFVKLAAVLAVAVLAIAPVTGCKQAPSLLANIGGMEGLSKFNDAFAANLLADPAVSKYIDQAGADMVKRGVTTSVAKASNVPIPSDGVDLTSFLHEKNLDEGAIAGFKNGANKAAKDVSLSPEATKGMTAMVDEVLKGLGKK
ncbi:MAG: hypothetical protein ACRENS_07195 [Candidatus Eiseniibacteriota bacterium]